MMPGVSEVWEEIGGGAGRLNGFNAPASLWRFEPSAMVTENNPADSAWMSFSSSQREMESLTRALQRELSSSCYENEASFAASSLRPAWKCKAESELGFEAARGMNVGETNIYEADRRMKSNVAEMNSTNTEEKGTNLIISNPYEKGLNLSKNTKIYEAERGKSLLRGGAFEAESLAGKGKAINSLSLNGAAKVSKRRSRAASKTPITFLNADPANFRAMVQQVTGVPLNPNVTRLWQPATGGIGLPALLKPEPKRPSSSSSSIIQGLPTLDTSALFIHAARQNPDAAQFRSFAPTSGPAPTVPRGNETFLTEKLRSACMQSFTKNNNGGGGDAAVDHLSTVNIVAKETDSWLNGSNLDGILIGSNAELIGGGTGADAGALPV